jgi:AraC-like DNA-binding protein
MQFLLDTLKLLSVIAIFQTLLMATYLFIQKKGNSNSRIVLAILLIAFGVFLTGTILLLFHQSRTIIYFGHLANLTVFLAAPLLYFYYFSLTQPFFKFKYSMLMHALPFVIILFIMIYEIVIKTNSKFVFNYYGIALLSILFLQGIFYLLAIYKERTRLKERKVDSEKVKWFSILFRSILLVFVLKLLLFVLWNIFGLVDVCMFFTGIFFILSFIIINMLVLYGLFNPDVLIHYVKYQGYSKNANINEEVYKNLQQLILEKKIYVDSLLNLERLGRVLNITEKQLSQLINENSGCNFNDFVNQYRIKEAQRLILDNNMNKSNILQIAYDVGFNSKSTFNTAFKKFTGITPSEYKRSAV